MLCPKCRSSMLKGKYHQWKCPNCNYEGICRKCEVNPVHPHRKWQLCLDCICDILEEKGIIDINTKWIEKNNDKRNTGYYE